MTQLFHFKHNKNFSQKSKTVTFKLLMSGTISDLVISTIRSSEKFKSVTLGKDFS